MNKVSNQTMGQQSLQIGNSISYFTVTKNKNKTKFRYFCLYGRDLKEGYYLFYESMKRALDAIQDSYYYTFDGKQINMCNWLISKGFYKDKPSAYTFTTKLFMFRDKHIDWKFAKKLKKIEKALRSDFDLS